MPAGYESDSDTPYKGNSATTKGDTATTKGASRRDAMKIARHFSAGITQQHKDESRRDE